MGYRLRIGRIAKTERDKYKGRTEEEVQSMVGEGFASYYPPNHEELYELGKYISYGEDFERFYDFKHEDNDFSIMKKEDLKVLIEVYHKKVADMYTIYLKIISDEPLIDKEKEDNYIYGTEEKEKERAKNKLTSFFYGKKNEWEGKYGCNPYSLDPGKDLVQSWYYEYAIFQLVQIYRTFDWDNDYMIYSGW